MKITVIVAKDSNGDQPWIIGAWDEYSMDANYQGFCDALDEHKKHNDEVRTAEIEVPDGFLESMWRPIKVQGKPV